MSFPPEKCLIGFSFSRKRNVSVVPFAAPREHSKPSETEIEMDLKQAGKAFLKGWKQDLASFKERVLKLQSEFQEVYEECSEKADVILKEAVAELEIQIDQARQDLSILTEELHEEARQCLILAAEISPKPVKDVVETSASADNLDDILKIYDFYIGIPYGAILSVGGFLDFMITGSISAIRFGVILGGILLALSMSSLRSWRRGEATNMTLKGQTAISVILFLKECLLFQGLTFAGLVKTVVSGAVAAFFMYRIIHNNPQK